MVCPSQGCGTIQHTLSMLHFPGGGLACTHFDLKIVPWKPYISQGR